MNSLAFVAICGAICAGADRLRGMDKLPALVVKILYGVVATAIVASPADGLWALAFLVVFVAGSSPGWGRPLGLALGGRNDPEYERWQVGFLRNDNRYALLARGLMWLLPAALLYFPTGNVMYAVAPVTMTVAFVLAPYIASAVERHVPSRWAIMELSRGAIFGVLTSLVRVIG